MSGPQLEPEVVKATVARITAGINRAVGGQDFSCALTALVTVLGVAFGRLPAGRREQMIAGVAASIRRIAAMESEGGGA